MANRTWIGSAPKRAQIQEYVFGGTWEATDVINVTIGTRVFSMAAGSVTTATVVSNLAAALTALTAANYPDFKEFTAVANSATLVLTGVTAGVPFIVTISTTETGGGAADDQTIDGGASSTGTETTTVSSPNHWSIAANWAENAVPVSSDTVVIDRGSVDILYGLDQSAVTLTSLTIKRSYTGKVGLPTRNVGGYEEYRETQLKIGATTIDVGQGSGTGSGRTKINTGTAQTALNVYGTATTAESGIPALCFRGTHASNEVNVYNGDVGIAVFSGETATVATLRQTGGVVHSASGVTLTTINKTGGTLFTESSATTVTNNGGDITLSAGAHATINLTEGTLRYESTGTITTLNIYRGGVANFNAINKTRTVTNCTVTDGGSIVDSAKTVTWTSGVDLYQCGIGQVSIDLGEHITLTPSAI